MDRFIVKATVSAPTSALVDATRDNAISRAKHAVSVIYQKEAESWKIIHMHGSIMEIK